MKLSTVLSETVPLAIPFGSEKLNVVYKPSVYTPEFESSVEAASEKKDSDALSSMLSGLLESWDLLTENDKGQEVPVPTDVKTLRGLPVKLLATTLRTIVKDFSPNKNASDATGNG
jgi:hypothetical protein